jgi:hypothetical protein
MKISAIILLTLVGTLVLNGPLQSHADPQLDALLRIAIQARDNLRMNISQISNVPDEINNLFKQGSDETDALSKVVDKQDAVSARQHFLSAMEFFKTTNDKINSLNSTQPSDQQQIDTLQLQDEITKLESIGERLKAIAITNQADFNFTQFDKLIEKAKQDLVDGNINEVSKSIEEANHIVIDAHHALAEVAQQRTTNRAKDFTEKQIERLDKIDLNTTQNTTITAPKISSINETNSNSTSLESSSDMIVKLRKLVTEGKVDEALKIIKLLDASRKAKLIPSENPEQSQNSTNTIVGNNETKSQVIQKGSSNSNQQDNINKDKTQKDNLKKQKLEKKINQHKSSIRNNQG